MENKNLILNSFKLENASLEDDFIKISGYAAHYNRVNLNSELVDERSFDYFFNLYNANELKPHLTWEHTDHVIGGIDSIVSKPNGLWMDAHLNNNVKIVQEMIAPNVLSGDIDSVSTEGFIRNGYDGIVAYDDGSYYVKDFVLTAVSVVRNPADSLAKFTVRNFIDDWKSQEKPGRKWYVLF